MTRNDVKALRERLSDDAGFIQFMSEKRSAAQRALNQCAVNNTKLPQKQIDQVMADYSAIVRLHEELILPEAK